MRSRPWIERTWKFSIPVEIWPCVVERLRGLPARAEEAVHGLAPEQLTRRVDDTWSIQENIGHVLALEELPAGRLDDFLAGADVLRPADMSNTATEEARFNARDMGSILAELRDTRLSLVARLDGLEPEDFGLTARHPRLDVPMRVVDMCLFQADHDDHHLARISELKRLL